jgi:hypothetical protein
VPTILRAFGMRFVIYVEDHPPPHVHVIGDGLARIAIGAEIVLMDQRGLSKRDIKRALDAVRENHALLLSAWKDIHG